MKMKMQVPVIRKLIVMLLVVSMVSGFVLIPGVSAASPEGFSINRVDGLKVDYQDYLDSSVMYQLPEAIRDDE